MSVFFIVGKDGIAQTLILIDQLTVAQNLLLIDPREGLWTQVCSRKAGFPKKAG